MLNLVLGSVDAFFGSTEVNMKRQQTLDYNASEHKTANQCSKIQNHERVEFADN